MKNPIENTFGLFFTPTAKKSYIALIDQALLSGTNFLTGVLLARFTEPGEYGAYVLALSVLLLVNGLQSALISGPMTVLGAPREGDDLKRYISTLAIGQVVMSAMSAALAFAVLCIMSFTSASAGLRGAFLGMASAVFFVQAQEFFRRVLFTRLLPGRVLLNDIVFCVIQLGGLFLLWRLDAGTAGNTSKWLSGRNVFFCMAGSAFVGSILGFYQARHFLGTAIQGARNYYRESWNYARWGLASYAGSILIVQASAWVIGGMAGVAAVGMIEAARLLVAPLHILQFGGPNIITPRAAKAYGQGGVRALSSFVRRLAPLWIAPFILYGLVVAIAPTFWLKLFFGEKYSTAGLVVTLWVAVYVVIGLQQMPALVLNAMRRPDFILYIILPEGVLTITLTAAFIRFHGAEWAVAGRLLSEVAGAAALFLFAYILLRRMAAKQEGQTS
jgi:O-antigen/teichoic acid export membrane protein